MLNKFAPRLPLVYHLLIKNEHNVRQPALEACSPVSGGVFQGQFNRLVIARQ
ncbi:hypothetical protein [Dickeya lacustris]|uniref:Uncharacterized protein n=1 Tax=Dickeya lacustris TaxID=2259638 RepID=A0ABY8G503_9GAMM|nr:hypothetical protein [Dickeya lacustris]WFN55000.1 hypothetical protein O1Q98_15300 [Dickeya lacustris]